MGDFVSFPTLYSRIRLASAVWSWLPGAAHAQAYTRSWG